jgi:hypothetical protein
MCRYHGRPMARNRIAIGLMRLPLKAAILHPISSDADCSAVLPPTVFTASPEACLAMRRANSVQEPALREVEDLFICSTWWKLSWFAPSGINTSRLISHVISDAEFSSRPKTGYLDRCAQ